MSSSFGDDDLSRFLHERLEIFHVSRLERLRSLQPRDLMRKNPYLHRSLNLTRSTELVEHLMGSFLSSSDEGVFGKLLEDLAIQICREAYGGQKASAEGADLDFTRDGVRYIVAIKSGPNWGNADQWKRLSSNLTSAIRRVRQEDKRVSVIGVCGMCYGNKKHKKDWDHDRVYGQDFWNLISGNESLYRDLIIPFGREADRYAGDYEKEKDRAYNRLTNFVSGEFVVDDLLDWGLIVDFVSKTG